MKTTDTSMLSYNKLNDYLFSAFMIWYRDKYPNRSGIPDYYMRSDFDEFLATPLKPPYSDLEI